MRFPSHCALYKPTRTLSSCVTVREFYVPIWSLNCSFRTFWMMRLDRRCETTPNGRARVPTDIWDLVFEDSLQTCERFSKNMKLQTKLKYSISPRHMTWASTSDLNSSAARLPLAIRKWKAHFQYVGCHPAQWNTACATQQSVQSFTKHNVSSAGSVCNLNIWLV